VHFSTCSSARAEKTYAFSVMGKTTVDVATVKDAAKHTAVFIDNLFVEKENNPSFCCCVVVFFSSFPAAFVFVFIITRRCRFIVVGVFGNFLCALLENEGKVAALVLVASVVVVVIAILDVLSGWFYVENKARLCTMHILFLSIFFVWWWVFTRTRRFWRKSELSFLK